MTFQPFGDYESAVAALKNGQVRAVAADSSVLSRFAQSDPAVILAGELLTSEPFALGLPNGDVYFRHLVNSTLQDLKTSGQYDVRYRHWFGAESTPFALEMLPGTWPYTFATSPNTPAVAAQSHVDQVIARGRIVAGIGQDGAPLSLIDGSGQPAGFEVDLVREFAKRWLGDEAAVEFLPVAEANRMAALADGQMDLLVAALLHSRDGEELVDFSQTYWRDALGIVVRQDSGLAALTDLNGRTVAGVQGSAAMAALDSAAPAPASR